MRTLSPVGLLAACIATCTGCLSERASSGIANAIVAQVIAPPTELAVSVINFSRENGRWPTNYIELTSSAKSDHRLALTNYDRVDFNQKKDGSIEIYAVAPGVTNQMTLTLEEPQRE